MKFIYTSLIFTVLLTIVEPFLFSWLFKSVESCDSNWIAFNFSGFNDYVDQNVYGQPLVGLSNIINRYWSGGQPRKALVLSFHGHTGTGKSYVASILARHMFKKGIKSMFYHLISAKVHFPDGNLLNTYKGQLRDWVRGNMSNCGQSVFVFDEVDKMPHSLLDTLKPFIDYHEHIDGVDYRRSIFVFISNSGSELITRYTADQKRLGRHRSEVFAYLDNELPRLLYSQQNGFLQSSELLSHFLVSRFMPFLPLERQHVRLCVEKALNEIQPSRQNDADFIGRVLNEFQLFLPGRGTVSNQNEVSFLSLVLPAPRDREQRHDWHGNENLLLTNDERSILRNLLAF